MMNNPHGSQHINSIIIRKKSICIALLLVLAFLDWLDTVWTVNEVLGVSRAATAGKAGKVWSLPRF